MLNFDYSNLDQVISDYSITAVILGFAALAILTTLSLLIKHQNSSLKKLLFSLFCLVTISTTLFLGGSTIYLNSVSASGGPVHYHADIEIWACGQELNLKDPTGWSNKIGTATLHEHNDKRIHLEGVIVEPQDASLGKFFKVIGGKIDENMVMVPTNEGDVVPGILGNYCQNNPDAKLQVFVYKVIHKTIVQTKVKDPTNYIIAPQSQVPDGDCIIIEYDSPKDRTDKLCRSYQVAKEIGKIHGN
jgi:hypothetical protein